MRPFQLGLFASALILFLFCGAVLQAEVIRDNEMNYVPPMEGSAWATFNCERAQKSIDGISGHYFEVTASINANQVVYQDITENLTVFNRRVADTTFYYSVMVKNVNGGTKDFRVVLDYMLHAGNRRIITLGTHTLPQGTWQHLDGSATIDWDLDAAYKEGLRYARIYVAKDDESIYQFDQFSLRETANTDAALPPTADLVAVPGSGLTVTLDASRSADANGQIVSYAFDMDNDGIAEQTGGQPSYTAVYTSPGVYTAGLSVTDNDGQTSEMQITLPVPLPERPAEFDGYARMAAVITDRNLDGGYNGGTYKNRVNDWLAAKGYAQADILRESTLDGDIDLSGSAEDPNGQLLYPDGSPRYRVVAMPGGYSYKFINGDWQNPDEKGFSGYKPVWHLQQYFKNGGNWTGSCAGASFGFLGFHNGYDTFLERGGRYHHRHMGAFIPHPVYEWVQTGARGGIDLYLNTAGEPGHFMLEESELGLLDSDGYGTFRDRGQYSVGIYMPADAPGGQDPDIDYLLRYDPDPPENPDPTKNIIKIRGGWAAMAYRQPANPLSGLYTAHFFHAEQGGLQGSLFQESGLAWVEYMNRCLEYTAQHAASLPLAARAKLENGQPITPAHNIGDHQYHYYVLELDQAMPALTVALTGLSLDCDLYVSKGRWPTRTTADAASQRTGTAAEQVTIADAQPGVYFVAVDGAHDVPGGTPYTLKAEWNAGGAEPFVNWQAQEQTGNADWKHSSWGQRSFRVLVKRTSITMAADRHRLVFKGRTDNAYTLRSVSISQRDGTTLDVVDETFTTVTFARPWEEPASVPANGELVSDAFSLALDANEDYFVTFWLASPALLLSGTGENVVWTRINSDDTTVMDWESLAISEARSNLYALEKIISQDTGEN
ncbi:MAG: PKD domain-containing protein [Desulfobacter sp.]